MKARRSSGVARILFLIAAVGCGTTTHAQSSATGAAFGLYAPVVAGQAEPVFAAPSTAQASLVASLVTAGPGGIVADLDALSRRLGLPMQAGQELLSWIGSSGVMGDAQHFRQLWERLDPAAPVAIVWLLPPKSTLKGYCAALAFRDASSAKQTLAGLGRPGAERDGLFERTVPGAASVWATVKGRTLLVSNSPEVLRLGGGLTEAMRKTPQSGQVVLSVLPQALARATGQSNREIAARVAGALDDTARSTTSTTTPASRRMLSGLAESMTKMALEASEARLVLDVGPREGITLRGELVPSPGTDLSARVARRSAYAFDPRLPVRNDGTAVLAVGDLSPWFLPFASAFEASGPAGRALRGSLTQWFAMVGDVSCVVEPVAVGYTSLCSSSLKKGTEAKPALDAAVALLTAENAWEAELEGRKATPVTVKRKKDSVEVDKKIQGKDATARALAKAMAGGDTVKTVIAIKEDRLVQGTGQAAREKVAAYGQPGNLHDAPIASAALAGTQGAEAMALVDVVGMIVRLASKVKGLMENPLAVMATSLPGVADMQAPFVFDLRTGEAMSAELRIPLASLDRVSRVVRGLLGGPAGGR